MLSLIKLDLDFDFVYCDLIANITARITHCIATRDAVCLGQFIHQSAKYVRSSFNMKTSSNDDSLKLIGRLTFSGPHVSHRTVRAVMARRRDMAANQHRPCWHVTRNGAGLIRGRLDDYIVPNLLVKQSSFSLAQNTPTNL